MSKSRIRAATAAIASIVAGTVLLAGGSASAYTVPDPMIDQAPAPANSCGSPCLINRSVHEQDINRAVVDMLRTPKAGSVWQNTLNDGIVTEPKLSTAVRAKLNAPDKDANGKAEIGRAHV